MEPQCSSVAKHTEHATTSLKCYLHQQKSQEHNDIEDFCAGRDKFWEGQWPSNMEDWVAFNRKAQGTNRNLVQSCDSPLASDSSSSASTRESSYFSWNSEASHTAAKHVLQSPELLSSRFLGFSLFNAGINHLEAMIQDVDTSGEIISRDEHQHHMWKHDLPHRLVKLNQSMLDGTIQRPLGLVLCPVDVCKGKISNAAFAQIDTPKVYPDDGWVSDPGDSRSWASTSSQECTKKGSDMRHQGVSHSSMEAIPCGFRNSSTGFASLQPEGAKVLSSCTKSSYSAVIEERFASATVHGYLRFVEQDGSPCYSFFVDDSDEVLFARACEQERWSNKENGDWMYSFHSKKDNGKAKGAPWKGWPKKERLASDLVANMRVLSVCKAKKNQDGCTKEVHFVLYDGREKWHAESRAVGSEKLESQPLKPVFDNMAPTEVGHTKQRVQHCCMNANALKISATNDVGSNGTSKKGSCQLTYVENACVDRLSTCINHQTELAAIVISTSVKEKKMTKRKESKPLLTQTPGWGFKFLDKHTESGRGSSAREKSSKNARCLNQMACQSSNIVDLPNAIGSHTSTCPDLAQKLEKRLSSRKSRLKVDVTVILPAGDHGWPTEYEENVSDGGFSHGPTPLLERWASGGDCECGGWDAGCGLSVFKAETLTLHQRAATVALTRNDRMNWLSPGRPFKVFTQGYKQKKLLVLEIIEAGLFSLSFQAPISPLQAFFIAVALFHQQMTHK